MIRPCVLLIGLIFTVAPIRAGQSPDSAAQSTAAPAATQTPAPKPGAPDITKKKTKKVWTNDEIGSVKGGVSVVGDSAASSGGAEPARPEKTSAENVPKQQQIVSYRDQIRQLQGQLDAVDKKIADLRNFKAENTSASGGVNMKQGYSMTPVADQVKQLEDTKKQIQGRMDAVEEDARKNGIEPGQLR